MEELRYKDLLINYQNLLRNNPVLTGKSNRTGFGGDEVKEIME